MIRDQGRGEAVALGTVLDKDVKVLLPTVVQAGSDVAIAAV